MRLMPVEMSFLGSKSRYIKSPNIILTSTITKIMVFFAKFVWVMEYYRFMGFCYEIPANQLGGLKMLCFFAVYGLNVDHRYGLGQVRL